MKETLGKKELISRSVPTKNRLQHLQHIENETLPRQYPLTSPGYDEDAIS